MQSELYSSLKKSLINTPYFLLLVGFITLTILLYKIKTEKPVVFQTYNAQLIEDRQNVDKTYKYCEKLVITESVESNACIFVLEAKKYDTFDLKYQELHELSNYIKDLDRLKILKR